MSVRYDFDGEQRAYFLAEFHLSLKHIKRSEGRSVIAAASYRAGERLTDQQTGTIYDNTNKPDVLFSTVLLPANANDRLADRQALWNEVEKREFRKDSQLASDVQFQLPHELSDNANIKLALDYAQKAFVERGLIVDVAVHKPFDKDGMPKPHCHCLIVQRHVSEKGLGLKDRSLYDKKLLLQWREVLAVDINRALAANGIEARVDHRSYSDRGIALTPQNKIGFKAADMEKKGQKSQRMAQHKVISRENGKRLLVESDIAIKALFEQQSTITHIDIAKLVSRNTVDDDQFQAVYAKVRAHPDLVLLGKDADGNERFSSKEMIAVEKALAEHAESLAGRRKHGLGWMSERRAFKGATLGPEQQEALKHVVGKEGLALVAGYAGTGKSRMLESARRAWEISGYRVIGATISGIAAEGLQGGSGIESRTIASLEYAWGQNKDKLTKNDVLIIDEAGMVGSRQMERLLSEARQAGAKCVLVGDAEQLQPIAAGSAFRALTERHGVAHLTAVRRQQSPWMRKATEEFANGNTEAALIRYHHAGMVKETETREDARARLIAMWDHDRQERPDRVQIILTHTRAEVAELNALARNAMRDAGDIGEDEVAIQTERGERRFSVGDRLMCLKNDRDLAVKNGSIGTVREAATDRIVVQFDDGTMAGKGREVAFNPAAYPHLEHAYAATFHKSQGITVRNAYVLATSGMDRNLAYIALTRHTRRAEMLYAREDFKEGFATLARRLARDGRKDTTLDYERNSGKMLSDKLENMSNEELAKQASSAKGKEIPGRQERSSDAVEFIEELKRRNVSSVRGRRELNEADTSSRAYGGNYEISAENDYNGSALDHDTRERELTATNGAQDAAISRGKGEAAIEEPCEDRFARYAREAEAEASTEGRATTNEIAQGKRQERGRSRDDGISL